VKLGTSINSSELTSSNR